MYERVGACEDLKIAAAHGGSIACVSAAEHLGLWVAEHGAELHVGLRPHGRVYEHQDCSCVVHWNDEETKGSAFGVPSVRVVLRQILRCQGLESFFVSLESALRQRKLTSADLAWLRNNTNRQARDAIAFAHRDADSGLESLFRWRLRRHRLDVRTQQEIVSVGRVDFVIGERLIVEVDGAPNHDGASHRHKDLVRDANAAAWGLVSLRFDYAMVVHDWETVELAILGLVDRGLHLA
ncbi:DUF559 domain-containing protein [Microbacterium sp. QXD-8]|uniref:DUF559 domain-containing protein n=1 Tax=Microbacterium psychrotolerans TaxID=3068321 RepID=A0ABU0Z2M4_9MICO|nr:DUF559 domain-containing protein [Microbacterium sp. QXD-8]MDQ7878081.1 DUF559 domain-containing protein [Microbacterium sp. QXD-8]